MLDESLFFISIVAALIIVIINVVIGIVGIVFFFSDRKVKEQYDQWRGKK